MLCLVAPNETDVFAFIQVCAINLNWKFLLTLDRVKFPLVREVPLAHIVPVSTTYSSSSVPCLMKCVHREVVDLHEGLSLEVTMTFEPLVPLATMSDEPSSSTTQQFKQELPLADNNKVEVPEGIFFPDVDLDNVFMQELSDFARTSDNDVFLKN